MTLDEAIEHCKEVSKSNIECEECCSEHLELKKWLEELKSYKEEKEVICKCVDRGITISGEYDIESNMHCPNCNEVVGDYEWRELFFKYCPECGQKLKYTQVEE